MSPAKDGVRLKRAHESNWVTVGGPADQIWFVNGSIWATSPETGNLFQLPVE